MRHLQEPQEPQEQEPQASARAMSEEEKKTHVDEEGREWKQRYCDYNKAFFWVCQEGDGEIPDKAAGLDGIFPPPSSELAQLVAGPPVNKGSDERECTATQQLCRQAPAHGPRRSRTRACPGPAVWQNRSQRQRRRGRVQ